MADASNSYFNGSGKTGIRLEFFHVPSSKTVSFKAFLTSMSDSFQSNYNQEAVYGRMDPFQIFQGTQRNISLTWQIPSYSNAEAMENLRRCSLLASFLYPSYDILTGKKERLRSGAIKGAPIIKIKYANLITSTHTSSGATARRSGLAGAMSGLNVNPIISEGYVVNTGPKLYPKLIELSCDFAVIHQHPLCWRNRRPRRGMRKFPYGMNVSSPIDTSTPIAPTTNDATIEAGRKTVTDAVAASKAATKDSVTESVKPGELSQAQKQKALQAVQSATSAGGDIVDSVSETIVSGRKYVAEQAESALQTVKGWGDAVTNLFDGGD